MAASVKVSGLREVDRAFRLMDKDASKRLRKALREAARPVAEAAQEKLSRYQGASVPTIRPRATARGAFVTQGARTVTGLRADFGVLEMTHVLEPALAENYDEILKGAEHAINQLGRDHGF